MRCKIGTYRQYLCVGWLCLLIFAVSQIAYANLKIYYVRPGQAVWENTLWRMDTNGENKELFLKLPVPMLSPTISPDGQHILFTTQPIELGGPIEFKMMVMDFDGSNLRKLLAASPRPVNMFGKWSPDGKWIVYGAFEPAQQPHKFELFVTEAQGLNSFQIATDLEDSIVNPFWFPDSRRIGFSIIKRGSKLHWINVAPEARAEEMEVELFIETIYWSPNGQQTIVVRAPKEGARNELFIGDALGKNLIRLTDDAEDSTGGQWLPDGKQIVYTTDSERPDVAVMNINTKEVQRLTDDGRSQFAFSRLQWNLRTSYRHFGVQSKHRS